MDALTSELTTETSTEALLTPAEPLPPVSNCRLRAAARDFTVELNEPSDGEVLTGSLTTPFSSSSFISST